MPRGSLFILPVPVKPLSTNPRALQTLPRDCGQDSGGRYRCEACQAKSAGYVRTASKAKANPDVGKDV